MSWVQRPSTGLLSKCVLPRLDGWLSSAMQTLPVKRAHGGQGHAGLGIESFEMSTLASSGIGALIRWGTVVSQRRSVMKIYVKRLHLSIQHWNLIRRNGARRACRRFACDAMEQFVQVGLLPERDAR